MSRTEYVKDAVNFVMMVRGLPYHTSAWVERHENEEPEILVRNAIPETLSCDDIFCRKCFDDYIYYMKRHPQASEET